MAFTIIPCRWYILVWFWLLQVCCKDTGTKDASVQLCMCRSPTDWFTLSMGLPMGKHLLYRSRGQLSVGAVASSSIFRFSMPGVGSRDSRWCSAAQILEMSKNYWVYGDASRRVCCVFTVHIGRWAEVASAFGMARTALFWEFYKNQRRRFGDPGYTYLAVVFHGCVFQTFCSGTGKNLVLIHSFDFVENAFWVR